MAPPPSIEEPNPYEKTVDEMLRIKYGKLDPVVEPDADESNSQEKKKPALNKKTASVKKIDDKSNVSKSDDLKKSEKD